MSAIDDLEKSMKELRYHLDSLRDLYGPALYDMKGTDGKHLVSPILIALVNGQTALVHAKLKLPYQL